MAQMHIHTVATDKPEYVRIVGSDITSYKKTHIGAVGIVYAHAREANLIFVTVHGQDSVFNTDDVEYITKKEYFIGALGG